MCRFFIIPIFLFWCLFPPSGLADTKTYKWQDYTKPFNFQLQSINDTNIGIIEVDLPKSVIESKEVVLIFSSRDSIGQSGYGPSIVLSANGIELPMFPKGKDTRAVLKREQLRPGLNRFAFSGFNKWGYTIYDLRIELKEPVAQIPKTTNQSREEQVFIWGDYTQPFKTRFQVEAEKPGIVQVTLPESYTEYDDIALRVSTSSAAGKALAYRILLEVNGAELPSLSIGPGARILLPKDALKPGSNNLKFLYTWRKGDFGNPTLYAVDVYEIGFDFPTSKTSVAKDTPLPTTKSTEKTSSSKSEQSKTTPRPAIVESPQKGDQTAQSENAGSAAKATVANDSVPASAISVEASLSAKPELLKIPQFPANLEPTASMREETLQVTKTMPKVEIMPSVSSPDRGQRWAVVIGVSEYEDSRIPSLRYAAQDAKSVYEWLVSPNGGRFAPSRVKLLLDRNATNDNIKDTLFNWLKQAIEEDLVLIYFAGHGSPESPDALENLYLLPSNTKYSNIAVTGFPMWDIETALKRFIKAKRVVIIADACHSAGVGQAFDMATRTGRGIQVNSIHSGFQGLTYVAEGICVISASRDKEVSREGREWGGGHGVFSYFLLEGLKGAGDLDKNGTVTIGELTVYVSEQVRRATMNAQNPIVSGRFDPALTVAK